METAIIARTGVTGKPADAGTENIQGKITKAYKPAFRKEISGSVKNIKVISQKYYPECRECQGTLEIMEKRLKKKLKAQPGKSSSPDIQYFF